MTTIQQMYDDYGDRFDRQEQAQERRRQGFVETIADNPLLGPGNEPVPQYWRDYYDREEWLANLRTGFQPTEGFVLADLGAKLHHNWDFTDASTITIATGVAEVADKGAGGMRLFQTTAAEQPPFDGSKISTTSSDHNVEMEFVEPLQDYIVMVVIEPDLASKNSNSYMGKYEQGVGSTDFENPTKLTLNFLNGSPSYPATQGDLYNLLLARTTPSLVELTIIRGDNAKYGINAFPGSRYRILGDHYEHVFLTPDVTEQELFDARHYLKTKHGVA